MKKLLLIILTACTVISFSSCIGNDKKAESKNDPDSLINKPATAKGLNFDTTCAGVGIFLIDSGEAATMRKKYAELYLKSSQGKYLSDSIWIDAKVIIAFADLLKDRKYDKYDGARFINATKKEGKKCTVILVPTEPREVTNDNESTHANVWTTIVVPGTTPEFQDYSLGRDKTKERQDLFKTLHSNGKHLSASVWISECVITSLSDFIAADSNNIDGIRVWFGAYSDYRYRTLNRSQVYKDQSTIILVPTHPDGNRHVDDWKILKAKSNYNKNFIDAYNHGELCPQKCDTIQ